MTLQLFNTLTRRAEPFVPLAAPRVTIYACGPTVRNFAHVGNFRTFLTVDLLRRHLEDSGYDVFHISNLTDVDDRTIQDAAAKGVTLAEHTAPYIAAFFEDADYLRIRRAHLYPRATEHIPAMIELVSRLLESGVAYRADDGSVYFAVDRFPGYGRLSGLEGRELKPGARVASDEYSKDDPRDFALWKAVAEQDAAVGAVWDAPFGRGRPGWHLECSAMSLEAIRARFEVETLDIHCGAVDLIFPHHEDEIAQSEAATGVPFARHWLHGAFLQGVDGQKMAKRFGNFVTARDLRESGWDGAAYRHFVFGTHYRQLLNLSEEALHAAAEGVRRLGEFGRRLEDAPDAAGEAVDALARGLTSDWRAALDDDLNAPRALAALHTFVREANRALDGGAGVGEEARSVWRRLVEMMDLLPTARVADRELEVWVEGRVADRAAARQAGRYDEADSIRDELRRRGVELEDTPRGTVWRLG
jgi:cysteinyl-tRNA synthetase